MNQSKESAFVLVDETVLSDAMKKTLQVKKLLRDDPNRSVGSAAEEVGLSRSAFYKYKDHVYPFHSVVKERIVSLFLSLDDQKGSLAILLDMIASVDCNVLTIHQSIPIQGKATVTLSLDISSIQMDLDEFLSKLKKFHFVKEAELVSSGAS